MDDAADLRERLIQFQMGLGIRRGIQLAIHHLAVQIQHHQIVRGQLVVGNAGGLDDHKSPLPVDAGNVAPRIRYQSPVRKLHIGFINRMFQFFQHE